MSGAPAQREAPATAAVAAAVASAALYGTPYAPTSWSWMPWVLLVPLLWALRRGSRRAALWAAGIWAVVAAYTSADALPWATASYYDQPLWVGFGFFVPMATVTTSTVMVVAALAIGSMERYDARLRPLLVAATWVGAELVRARALGNPWADLGYALVSGWPTLAQIADRTGVWGLSFLAVATNAALLELVLARRGRERRQALVGAALVATALAAATVYGRAQLGRYAPNGEGASPVLIVQGNADLGSQWRDEFYGQTLDIYMEATTGALAEAPARLVVWPENAMTFFVEREPLYRAALASMLADSGAELVAGGPRAPEGEDGTTYYNSVFLLGADGHVRGHYDKRQLLPFAEYFPVPWLDMLRRDFGSVREFTSGTDTAPLATAIGRAGVVVCNESLFAEIVGRRVAQGAEFLVNLTNDGWLADARLSDVAFSMTRLRAIEQRRFLLRASTSGPSAVVDPAGRALEVTGHLTRAVVRGHVAASRERTAYSRWGDTFAMVCLLLVALACLPRRRSGVDS